MKSISIFGLGYVGAVTAACLASRGYKVIGVDPNPVKVDRIRQGSSPIIEAEMQSMIESAHHTGLLTATTDPSEAVSNSDISFISVGTPTYRNGKLDLSHIVTVSTDIGHALRKKDTFHWIVLRSTVLPGTTEEVVVPAIEAASGKKSGRDFVVCFNPEFLREGTAVKDFFNPPFTVIGSENTALISPVVELYSFLTAPIHQTPIRAAEMIKYSCNAFHALKIAFANEMGSVCSMSGIDAKLVFDIFKSDTHLNVSPAYLSPGFAFGGSCLPKDLRALTYRVRELDLKLPLLDSILPSNEEHIDRVASTILTSGKRKVGLLGLSFKPGTDDLRESPMVHLVKKLIAEGCQVRIWDRNVSLGQLIGSNRQFIHEYIPHIGALLQEDMHEVIDHAELVVLATNAVSCEALRAELRDDQSIIDVTNLDHMAPKSTAVLAAR